MQPEIFDTRQDEYRTVDNPVIPDEGIKTIEDPLALSIPDDELVKVVDHTIETSKKFWKTKYNLTERRRKLEKALFGREIPDKEKDGEYKDYEARYSDNALYEIEATLKPVAMSHIPDMIVTPGQETLESQESADDLSQIVNDDLKKRANRQVLGLGFKHLPVYLTAIIKAQWNPTLGDSGDYEFVNVLPENVIIDYSAHRSNAGDMRFIPEIRTMTVQDLVMRFPDKKEDLFKKLKSQGLATGDTKFNWKDLASEIKIWEVWFTWYVKAGSTEDMDLDQAPEMEEPGNKWEKVEGVLWKYDDIILKKMKNPTFDYEGSEEWFTYDDPSMENSKRSPNANDVMQVALSGMMPPNIQKEQIYFNYFKAPEKPYFFFGYDQWGKTAIDETSRIEQNYFAQKNLNDMGKQIIETIKERVKHIWSTDSGLTASDIQSMDMANPKLDVLIDGNVEQAHKSIMPERPDAAQFNALKMAKDDMFGLAGATALTGQIQTDVATTNQIAREQNFTRADDLVEDTINAACEWMARWAMQFIKLRYTEEHMRKLLGNKGSITFIKLKRDKIEDGMEVMIKASGTDKLKAQRNAMDAAKLGAPFVNPIDFFKDMEYSDPEGRAERGITFAMDPATYLTKYVMDLKTTEQQVNGLLGPDASQQLMGGQLPPQFPPVTQPAQAAQTPFVAGRQNPGAPPIQSPTPTDTTNIPVLPQGSPRNL